MRTFIRIISSAMLILFISLNCSNPDIMDKIKTTYNVTFNSQGGSKIESLKVNEGQLIPCLPPPRKKIIFLMDGLKKRIVLIYGILKQKKLYLTLHYMLNGLQKQPRIRIILNRV